MSMTIIDSLSLPELARAVTAFFLVNTALGLAIGYAFERVWQHPIWRLPVPDGQLAHEIKGNIVFLAISIASLTAALAFQWARVGDESVLRFALTFAALFVGFQCFYYALHRAMHTQLLLPLHRWHHVSHVTTPMSGQSTSVGEALGWMLGYVALPVALSFVAPISLSGWLAYLAFNVVGNIAGHANSEIVKPSRWLWWRSTTAGTFTYHALHHARYTGNYGFESTWADRVFGTEFRDWPALHSRVWHKQPLERLQDRA